MSHNPITLLSGEIFKDHRGQISSLNDFRFDGVERVYFIHHPDASVVRGWHGHQHEKKWFYCVKGGFTEVYHLSEARSEILCVPEGYANCLKATEPGSVLLVFSGKILEEALLDSWRYDKELWMDWETLEPRFK